MTSIATFDLYRSRIPTSLLKSIVQDMDILLPQYGPLAEHATEEATSQFLAPVSKSTVTSSYCDVTQTPDLRSLIAWSTRCVQFCF
jgi:hypothetical protein